MKIGFHGAAQTVTGSRHLLHINGHRLLLDCGLYQGHRDDTYSRNRNFPFDPAGVDAVILSHAHIDHSGNLPHLVGQGFGGPIHATFATRGMTDMMTRDAGHIQEEDAAFLNRRRRRKGQPLIEPLYTAADAEKATHQLTGHPYDQAFEPIPGVQARFIEAGHILGSAGVVLDIDDSGNPLRLMFSGDIGRVGLPLLRDPVLPSQVDYLIMECTYGDRLHDSPDKAYEALHAVASETFKKGGKLIIPAFAVGRTQSLVYYLHQMIERHALPDIPVFVDSPLAINVTALYREHPECFDEETRQFIQADPHGAALGFDHLKYTLSVEESKAINDTHGPAVIISASGMAEVGRILHHLKNNIENPNNTILITSWMAPNTLGRRLSEGATEVRIFGEPYKVKARVASIDGLSAHADQTALVAYARATMASVKHIFLVHGEAGPAAALTEKLADGGLDTVTYPELNQEIEI
jgi:metallo-beta-lactamase family protein